MLPVTRADSKPNNLLSTPLTSSASSSRVALPICNHSKPPGSLFNLSVPGSSSNSHLPILAELLSIPQRDIALRARRVSFAPNLHKGSPEASSLASPDCDNQEFTISDAYGDGVLEPLSAATTVYFDAIDHLEDEQEDSGDTRRYEPISPAETLYFDAVDELEEALTGDSSN